MTKERMAKEAQMTNEEKTRRCEIRHSRFVIHSSFDIRHSSF